jgi:2-polyprenyl-6-methoxyphenol hydroxylase-like FAD-dependent oxidoreductase
MTCWRGVIVSEAGMAEAYDVITIGGGLAGAALAKRLAENGKRVLVLEREVAFRDRVRGEQMHCWGVAEARTLGLYELLLESCGHEVRYWSDRLVGFSEFGRRDLVKTSPHHAGSLNFYHPNVQSVVIGAAAAAGATVRRGARVVELVSDELPGVRVHEDGNGERIYRARLVVAADGRNSVCRRWGGFHLERDSEGMVIAGVLMKDLAAPADRMSASLNPRFSMISLTVPLGGGRFRAYVSIPVELQYLLLDPAQLSPECRGTHTSHLRNSLVVWIGHDIEQLIDTVASNRRNDPELGKIGPDGIDHRGLLTDEQMARAV